MRTRDDVLISVCLSDLPATMDRLQHLIDLSRTLSDVFSYFEIVATSSASSAENEVALRQVQNLRVLEVSPGHSEYRRRAISANEAIGDIILVADLKEMWVVDPLRLIEEAERTGKIAYGVRPGAMAASLPMAALGRASDLSVSLQHLRTIAFPRAHLNCALLRGDRELALRFPPLSREKSTPVPFPQAGRARRGLSGAGARLSLIHALMVNSAPKVLTGVSLLSCVSLMLAATMFVYAIVTFLVLESLEPGWFSTMMAISSISIFLSFSLFGISIGLQKVIEQLKPEGSSDVIGEKGSTDLFSSALRNLNVELATEDPDRLVADNAARQS